MQCVLRIFHEPLSALAIQWGMIGDVGVAVKKFGDKVTAVGRTLPQRMSSCLDSLDQFLCQSKPVVSSFVSASASMTTGTREKQQTLMEHIVKVLGKISEKNFLNNTK